jgi:hypothetical protein
MHQVTARKAKADFLECRFNVRILDYAISDTFPEFDVFVKALRSSARLRLPLRRKQRRKHLFPGSERSCSRILDLSKTLELDFARNKWKILLGDNGGGNQ